MDYRVHVVKRIEEKKADYVSYNFSDTENDVFKTFFDLAQELDNINDFYTLCVMVPKIHLGVECRLYLFDPNIQSIILTAQTEDDGLGPNTPPPEYMAPADRAYHSEKGSLVLTIRGKKYLTDELPLAADGDVLGFLEVYPCDRLDAHRDLFFEKYANRIGFNLHNRLLVIKNIEHLKFIRSLVADIEHNVIVPNMIYRLYLRRLRGEILKNRDIEKLLDDALAKEEINRVDMEALLKELRDANAGLSLQEENLEKHYSNMSLFIETLFRKSHFDQGRLTLRTKKCNMKKDVIEPQLERYKERFEDAGVTIDDHMSVIPDEEVITVVDVGLIAQVYANLFSNALKYSEEVEIFGQKKKFIAYGQEIVPDFFGTGRDGVKYNVFSSGEHIPVDERDGLFDEEYRAVKAKSIPGTGHGLAFVRNVIEIHGGMIGYEPTEYGNNFYFILPR